MTSTVLPAPSLSTAESLGRPRVRPGAMREVLLVAFLWLVYSVSRLGADDSWAAAAGVGEAIRGLESALHVAVEPALIDLLLRFDGLALAASAFYASAHYVVTAGVLAVVWWRAPGAYRWLRSALWGATGVALVTYLLMPTAPPRLVGYPDVLALTSSAGWWGAEASAPEGLGGLTNQLAAFPSMHAGWALWVAVAVCCTTSRWGWRALGVGHAGVTAVVVVATGNHWVVDVLAGWAVVAAALLLVRSAHQAAVEVPEACRGTAPGGRGQTRGVRGLGTAEMIGA